MPPFSLLHPPPPTIEKEGNWRTGPDVELAAGGVETSHKFAFLVQRCLDGGQRLRHLRDTGNGQKEGRRGDVDENLALISPHSHVTGSAHRLG